MHIYETVYSGKGASPKRKLIIKLPNFTFTDYVPERCPRTSIKSPQSMPSSLERQQLERVEAMLRRRKAKNKNEMVQTYKSDNIVILQPNIKKQTIKRQSNTAKIKERDGRVSGVVRNLETVSRIRQQMQSRPDEGIKKELLVTKIEMVQCKLDQNEELLRQRLEEVRNSIRDKDNQLKKIRQMNNELDKQITSLLNRGDKDFKSNDLQDRIRQSQEMLNRRALQERRLFSQIQQVEEHTKQRKKQFQEKYKKIKSHEEGKYLRLFQEIQLQNQKVQAVLEERNYFYAQASKMQQQLRPKQKASIQVQTKFKNISQAKIYVEWYQSIDRASILKKIAAQESELQLMPSQVQKIAAGDLYIDREMDAFLPSLRERLTILRGKALLFSKSHGFQRIKSKNQNYSFVMSYLLRRDVELVARLLEQPKTYKGIYGCWLFIENCWRSVQVDNRFDDSLSVDDKYYLWNVILQKAIMKRCKKKFEDLRIQDFMELLTGSSYYKIEPDYRKDNTEKIRKALDERKLIVAQKQRNSYVAEYYLSEREGEEGKAIFISLWKPNQEVRDSVFFKLECPDLHFIIFNFYPEYFFSSCRKHLPEGKVLACDLEVTSKTKAFIRASNYPRINNYHLLALLYRQQGKTLILQGETSSKRKGLCLFEFTFDKGKYVLFIVLHAPRRNAGIVQSKDFNLGLVRASLGDVYLQVAASIQADKPLQFYNWRTMEQLPAKYSGESEQFAPLTDHKFLDYQIRTLLLRRAELFGKTLEQVAQEEWTKFLHASKHSYDYMHYDKKRRIEAKIAWKDYLLELQIAIQPLPTA